MAMNKDLTQGKPAAVLWKFCLPLFGSIVFQQMYNIADSLVAGKFIGENALASVGNSYEITLIFLAFAFGTNMGCSVVAAQLYGAKKEGELKTAVYTTLIAGGCLCALLMAVGFLFSRPLLGLINTPELLMADSQLYLDIYVLGLPFVFYYNIATGVFSALGDSKTPFLFLAVSSTANVAMDVLFVTTFRMGVAGVAWATFLCQGVACALAMVVMLRRIHPMGKGQKSRAFSGVLLKRISLIAVPSILQQGFISVGNIVIQGVINGFGPAVMAGYSASIKLNNLVISSLNTLGNGISNFTAQNIGAGMYDRVKSGFRAGLKMVWLVCVPFVLLYFFVGRPFVTLFMEDPQGEALNVGVQFLQVVSPVYFLAATKICCDGVLRGAGLMRQFVISTFADLFLRVGLSMVLSAQLQSSLGIWLSWPIGWLIGMLLSVFFYTRCPWNKKQRAVPADNSAR